MTFRLVQELAAEEIPVAVACRVLKVPQSGSHAWRSRPPSRRTVGDAELMAVIRQIHEAARGTYGIRRDRAKRCIGCAIADHLRAEAVLDAVDMARLRRQPDGAVLHSDRGTQFTSWLVGQRMRKAGLMGSMGKVASAYDNVLMESFWGSMQLELQTGDRGRRERNSPPRCSSGSRVSTTVPAATRRWG